MSETSPDGASPEGDPEEMVEVARAHDRLESTIWTRHLEDMGIQVRTETKGGIIRAILYLGRVPVAVYVPRKDYDRAHEFLKKFRFI
ncbi:MAG TPA: DUF2007 domain-containing protein [Dehalococcoidia bacterium]|nr:DUF2007 domain-containing protein [Dehalococcoidia bacterium]